MKRILSITFIIFIYSIGIFLLSPSKILAADDPKNCTMSADPGSVPEDYTGEITFTGNCFQTGHKFGIMALKPGSSSWSDGKDGGFENGNLYSATAASDSELTFKFNIKDPGDGSTTGKKNNGTWIIKVCWNTDLSGTLKDKCDKVGSVNIVVGDADTPVNYKPPQLKAEDQTFCTYQANPDNDIPLKVTGLDSTLTYHWWMIEDDSHHGEINSQGQDSADFNVDKESFNDPGEKTICVDVDGQDIPGETNCIQLNFTKIPQTDDDESRKCSGEPHFELSIPPCKDEIGEDGCTSINTAIGNIKTTPDTFLTSIFAIFLSLSGGIALLMIIRSGYQLMTSQGNAEKVKEAQDRITSAVVGLLFALFSLVILESIGVNILHLPGLSH